MTSVILAAIYAVNISLFLMQKITARWKVIPYPILLYYYRELILCTSSLNPAYWQLYLCSQNRKYCYFLAIKFSHSKVCQSMLLDVLLYLASVDKFNKHSQPFTEKNRCTCFFVKCIKLFWPSNKISQLQESTLWIRCCHIRDKF